MLISRYYFSVFSCFQNIISICSVDKMALLDALIEQLESDPASDDEADQTLILSPDEEIVRPDAPIRTLSSLERYRRNSSARRLERGTNCLFCPTNCSEKNFENHLRASPLCLLRYKRKLNVRSLDSVLLLVHYCLFCPSKGPQKLHNHLEQNQSCLNKFSARYQIDPADEDCIRKVMKRVGLFKKEAYPSRTRSSRKKENLKRTEEKCGTVESALNQFRRKITFANIFKCVLCSCFKFSNDVIEVDEIDAIDFMENQDLNTLTAKKRNGKFWKCINCVHLSSFQYPGEMNVRFSIRETNDAIIFSPILGDEEAEGEHQSSQTGDKQIKVYFPTSVECLKTHQDTTAKTVKNLGLLLFRGEAFFEPEVRVLYQNQISKYKSVKLNSDMFLAKVQIAEERKLSHVKLQVNQSSIVGSEMWKLSRDSDRHSMIKHFGSMCVKIELKIPLDSDEVIASCLIQEGRSVTASHESNDSHETSTEYFVHEGKVIIFNF